MILLTGKALEERIRGIQINPYIRYQKVWTIDITDLLRDFMSTHQL